MVKKKKDKKKNKGQDKTLVIEGVTEEGKQFRPSDWAERMSGKLATFKDRRINYSPMLQPSINKDGYKCVKLDLSLKESNPELYNSLLEFANNNNLKLSISDDDNCEDNEP